MMAPPLIRIPQIALGFSLILLPFRSPDKAEPVEDARQSGQPW